ncbi:E1A [Bat mastadenovirus]|nr:E1A [Bat mastadenovirus]
MGYIVCSLSQRGHSLVSSRRGFSAAPRRDRLLPPLLPVKMKKLALHLDSSILDMADQLLGEMPETPMDPPLDWSVFLGEDPPSLHALFDVTGLEDHPDFSQEVDLIFPSAEVSAAARDEVKEEPREEDFRCETPVVEVDLKCDESMISTSPESGGSPEEAESPEEGPSSRWGPLEPGDSPRPCRACTYHRIESNDPLVKCSLCWMKSTYYQVYSK